MKTPTGAAAPSPSESPTRRRLLRAAERLFAKHGIAATSTRAILREADQRNESALQYHFGGREGLIEALYAERGGQVGAERERMLRELEGEPDVDLRRLCAVAVLPAAHLARRDPGFVRFLKVIGQLAFLPGRKLQESADRYVGGTREELFRRMAPLVRLPEALLERRSELVHRMAMLSLAQRALAGEPFEGPEADLFFATLVDAMAGVLESTPSGDTRSALVALERGAGSKPRARRRKAAPRSKKGGSR